MACAFLRPSLCAAAVAELGISLYTNYTILASFPDTVLLFFPVCWTWIGVTFYAARFETDDVIHRVLVFVQIGGAPALALNIHGALGETPLILRYRLLSLELFL